MTWEHAYPISSLADGSNGSENIHCRDGDASQCPIHAAEPQAFGGTWWVGGWAGGGGAFFEGCRGRTECNKKLTYLTTFFDVSMEASFMT